MTTTENVSSRYRPAPVHRDRHGRILHVGDLVRYGDSEGTVLILEDWRRFSADGPDAGCYVSDIGHWGDCRAVAADRLELVRGAA